MLGQCTPRRSCQALMGDGQLHVLEEQSAAASDVTVHDRMGQSLLRQGP